MTTINTPSFSKLKRVPLREHFPNEARDFTPYLEENIDALSDELGLSLEVIQREAPVGDLSLDLLAKDMENSNIVIIENQLEKADHTHLGQLLAYAAGLDAKIVIWISDEFRDEYIQVLKWLNEQTHTEINFFAIAVELLQIEDSPIALNFRQVVVPNQWKKSVRPDGDTETQRHYRNFFQKLIDELRENHQFTNSTVAQPDTWHYFTAGRECPGFYYNVRFHQGTRVRVYVGIFERENENRLALFDALKNQKNAIEADFEGKFVWYRYPEKKESQIVFQRDGVVDWNDSTDIEEIHKWCVENLLKLKTVFYPKITEAIQAHNS